MAEPSDADLLTALRAVGLARPDHPHDRLWLAAALLGHAEHLLMTVEARAHDHEVDPARIQAITLSPAQFIGVDGTVDADELMHWRAARLAGLLGQAAACAQARLGQPRRLLLAATHAANTAPNSLPPSSLPATATRTPR